MNNFHGTWLSKTAALCPAIIGVIAVLYIVSVPMYQFIAGSLQHIDQLRSTTRQLQALASHGDQLRTVLTQLERINSGGQFFLQSDKASTGAAEIEQFLKTVVSRRGGTIISTQALPESESNNARSVSVKVRLRGKLPEISAILHNLEAAQVSLYISNLNIRSRNNAAPRPGQDRQWRDLDVEFDLMGYLAGGIQT